MHLTAIERLSDDVEMLRIVADVVVGLLDAYGDLVDVDMHCVNVRDQPGVQHVKERRRTNVDYER